MAIVVVRIHTVTTDAGECPMCGFDSLRRYAGYRMNEKGVSTVFDQKYCGRCINDMREMGNA